MEGRPQTEREIEETLIEYGFFPGDPGYEQAHSAYLAALIGEPRGVQGRLIDEWLDFLDELPSTGLNSPHDLKP